MQQSNGLVSVCGSKIVKNENEVNMHGIVHPIRTRKSGSELLHFKAEVGTSGKC